LFATYTCRRLQVEFLLDLGDLLLQKLGVGPHAVPQSAELSEKRREHRYAPLLKQNKKKKSNTDSNSDITAIAIIPTITTATASTTAIVAM
jgi:hypothetical protein